jgi:hypothetical protein
VLSEALLLYIVQYQSTIEKCARNSLSANFERFFVNRLTARAFGKNEHTRPAQFRRARTAISSGFIERNAHSLEFAYRLFNRQFTSLYAIDQRAI